MSRDLPRRDAEPGTLSDIIVAPKDWVVAQLPRALDERTGRIEDIDWPLEQNVRAILARRHGFDPDDKQAIAMWDTSLQTLMFGRMIGHMKQFFTIVGIVTLVLGGIGVMNIMLVAVKERTREIGVRKALGATTAVIQRQFFLEGFFLTLLSGGAGMLRRARLVSAGQPRADAGAVLRDDPVVAVGPAGARHAGRDRRRDVHLSRAPRGGTAAGRGAAVRDVIMDAASYPLRLCPSSRSCRIGACGVMAREIVREACFGLYHHRFRAALSMLGISWGIISVVVLLAYGDGFRGALDAGFRGAFSDGTVVAFPGQTSLQAGGERAGKRVRVDRRRRAGDRRAAAGQERQPGVHAAVPDRLRQQAVESPGSRRRRVATASMRAETPQAGGRFLDDEDVRLRRRVAFIGTEVQRKLFGGIPPVGETIRIAGQPFEIVGVMEEKVQLSNYNRPDKYCVFIPWTTMGGLTDNRYVGTFVWQAVSPMLEPKATVQVREFLAKRYRYNPADDARDQHARLGGEPGDRRRHRRRPEDRAHVHRRADAGDRRRRHHEHHVRERAGAHAGDRRAQGARRAAARDPAAVSARRARDHVRRRRRSASRCRGAWSGCSARGRSSPSCSTTRAA